MIIPINGTNARNPWSDSRYNRRNRYAVNPDRANSITDVYERVPATGYPEMDAGGETHQSVEKEDRDNSCNHEEWKDSYIRLKADFDNYKRHAEKDQERSVGLGKEAVLDDIFPLVEHLERAIQSIDKTGEAPGVLQGINIVYKELLSALEKHGIERVKTIGELFDPKIHDAVALAENDEFPEDSIVEEVRAGFIKSGKLLRPAAVVVAK